MQRLLLPQDCPVTKQRIPDAMPPPFQYRPLQDDEIRLLELLPSREHEMVSTRIHHVKTDSGVAYEAVSYAWGTGPKDHLILVDGHSFQLSQTLEAALVQFRRNLSKKKASKLQEYHDLDRFTRSLDHELMDLPAQPNGYPPMNRPPYLWIDAICINQNDVHERDHQIRKMANIYSQAQLLRIWLGRAERRSTMGIDILINHAYAFERGGDALHQWYQSLKDLDFCIVCYAVSSLLTRTWFQRAWVLQEYTLCSTISPEIYCGRGCFPWCVLTFFRENQNELLPRIIKILENEQPRQVLTAVTRGSGNGMVVQGYFLSDLHGGLASLGFFEATRVACLLPEYISLLRLLDTISNFDCKDPRDKLYSILGLAHLLPPGPEALLYSDFSSSELIIDYSATAEDVLSSVVRATVSKTKMLEVLRFCYPADVSTRTWTPEWQCTGGKWRDIYITFCQRSLGEDGSKSWRKPNACRSTEADFTFSNDLSTFTVKGIKWDRINRVFAPQEDKPFDNYDVWKELLARIFYDVRSKWAPAAVLLFRRRLSSCTDSFRTRSSPELAASWDDLLKDWILEWENHETRKSQVDSGIVWNALKGSVMNWDRLSLTDLGYICRSRNDVVEGDFVCVLLGCDVPVLLRQVNDHYEVAGEVFCDGIMFGEVIEDLERGIVKRKISSYINIGRISMKISTNSHFRLQQRGERLQVLGRYRQCQITCHT
jgi:Heterokaryon incompatibility protein (HET)